MKLADAMVATDGAMIARGTLELPSVPTERIACQSHEFLSIRLDHWCDVTPVTIKKCEDSGYLLTDPVGPALAFGSTLVTEFRSALLALTEPLEVKTSGGGGLSSIRNALEAGGQDIHDCTLICSPGPNRTKDFTFEATIGARKSEEWKSRNWPDAEGKKLVARFFVDIATACLVAGAVGDLPREVRRNAKPSWGGATPRLTNSVFSWSGSMYAVSSAGSIWGLAESQVVPCLLLDHAVHLNELESGFYAVSQRSYRLVITAFTLHQLLGFGSSDPIPHLRLEGNLGSFYSTSGREPDQEQISVIEGGVVARDTGFHVEFALQTEAGRELQVDFTLSRETSLVRYPRAYRRAYGELGG